MLQPNFPRFLHITRRKNKSANLVASTVAKDNALIKRIKKTKKLKIKQLKMRARTF